MANKPLIGIGLDWAPGSDSGFSRQPYYGLRVDYFAAVHAAGGLPVAIPHIEAEVADYLERIDGLLVPGGDFPFPDAWYPGAGEKHSPYADSASKRAAFDARLIATALERDKPLLGICAGMQALGAVCGCRLHGNVRQALGTSIDHRQARPQQLSHSVAVVAGTRLRDILGSAEIRVNSVHNEVIAQVPAEVRVNAIAPDGAIEGIEIAQRCFAIGVQWHPEYFTAVDSPHAVLLRAFVAAATICAA